MWALLTSANGSGFNTIWRISQGLRIRRNPSFGFCFGFGFDFDLVFVFVFVFVLVSVLVL